MPRPDQSALEAYHGRVQAVLWRAVEFVTAEGIDFPQHLLDHGEPPEALLALTIEMTNRGVVVPDDLANDIYDLAHDLVPAHMWPPGFPPASAS